MNALLGVGVLRAVVEGMCARVRGVSADNRLEVIAAPQMALNPNGAAS